MKSFEKEIKDILGLVSSLQTEACKENSRLPENCYIPDKDTAICFGRTGGDSRYPYHHNGFALWAYASGSIAINESAFYTVLPATGGKEPFVSFFGGLKKRGSYTPISIFDTVRQPREINITRYTVYTPKAVYYFADAPEALFVLRAYVAEGKEVYFSLYAQNKTQKPLNMYLSSYFNCLLKHATNENVETNWFKECQTTKNGYVFESVEDIDRTTHLYHFGVLNRSINGKHKKLNKTTARSIFTGSANNPLYCAESLFAGKFAQAKDKTKFTDTAIAGDIITFALEAGKSVAVDYKLTVTDDRAEAKALRTTPLGTDEADSVLATLNKADQNKFGDEGMLGFEFGKDMKHDLNAEVLGKFLRFVTRQVEFGALSKNSGVSLLGVRDVFQQIEAALIWNPTDCRAKILEALDFLDPSGRPPRQYSLPAKGDIPRMDLRPFIDQGVWIVNTVYTYLSYTGDYSILDEECGYYQFLEGYAVKPIPLRDSVLSHLLRIMDYLIVNIDETTNCLRALYGDWNDALDGLGTTNDKGKEYGSGVSVMASLQLYQNLDEMSEILTKIGKNAELVKQYQSVKERLKQGLISHAIEKNSDGQAKILHGWGDKMSYKVGSFSDPDKQSRCSLTSNAFWVIAGAYKWDTSIKDTILQAYERLDSKYGLRTFEPYFAKGVKGVGRIGNLPKGTAENAATYVHATVFGAWSLFLMGESKLAWEQLAKILPINNAIMSTTPFVMPNSYSYNEEYGMDGESMSDWYTGSANTLIKVLVKFVLGMQPVLDGLKIQPAKYFPVSEFKAKTRVKGTVVELTYRNTNSGSRKFKIDGVETQSQFDNYMQVETLFLPEAQLKGKKVIKVEVID